MSKEFRTSIGGQALMEGIMMRGPEKICCAVRKPDGTIDLTYDTVTVHWYNRVPLVRGVCNMAENLYKGYRYLMHAADIAMEGETEPAESKLDKWFEEHATPAVQNVLIISIFLYAVLPWTSTGMRIVYKLCMFPLLVGISYEILKWAGRSDSVLSKIVSQPGLWMQRLTTFEPDDSMIEVAIAAVTPVLPEKQEEARW